MSIMALSACGGQVLKTTFITSSHPSTTLSFSQPTLPSASVATSEPIWPIVPVGDLEDLLTPTFDDGVGDSPDGPDTGILPHFRPVPWWSPMPLADAVVSALRWPFSYASISHIPEVDTPYALAKSIVSALKWPFRPKPSRLPADLDKDGHQHSDRSDPSRWSDSERAMRTIPQFVIDHAPLIHLFSGEHFWPCDMEDHLQHVLPFINYDPLDDSGRRYNLTDLDSLNGYRRRMFLTSDDNVEDRPDWLGGESNIPEEPSPENFTPNGKDPVGGRSEAPVVMLVVDKGNGVIDAFYFFFYCYNLGNKVLNVRFGNHVGDWEHTVIRFKHGKPEEMFFSQHIFGQAFTYEAVEKIGIRPVAYSATGTHAMYATPAIHRYVLPWGLLHDETDRGPLWDPLLNMHAYMYNATSHDLLASTLTPHAPIEWFYFLGHWGDKAYPLSDRRQYYFAGQYHYVTGPLGPVYKNLGRAKICINEGECEVKQHLEEGSGIRFFNDGSNLSDIEAEEAMATCGLGVDLAS